MPELKCTVQTCMHNQDFLCQRLRIVAESIVKQLTACTMNSVNVKRERSAWKVPVRVIRTAQSAPHFSADKK